MLNTKEMKLTTKLSTDMTFPSRKLFVETLPHKFLTQNTKKRFWQLKGTPEEEEGMRNEGEGWAIYRENSPPTPSQSSGRPVTLAYVRWSLYIGPEGARTSRYYLKGLPKSNVRLVVPRASIGMVYRVYVRWSPRVRPHYRHKRTSTTLGSVFSLYPLRVQGVLRLTLRVLGFHLSSSTKGLGLSTQ
jgi:hypothetical protein